MNCLSLFVCSSSRCNWCARSCAIWHGLFALGAIGDNGLLDYVVSVKVCLLSSWLHWYARLCAVCHCFFVFHFGVIVC